MDLRWYVINTYSGYENKVKSNLENRITSMGMAERIPKVMIPTEEISEMKGGKKKVSVKNYFPGYILVQMDLDDETWYLVRNTPKVTGFVGSGNKPLPLTEEEISEIMGQESGERPRVKSRSLFDKGEHIKIIDGPFASFSGTVDEVNHEREKLKVMVTIFGRSTPVELDFLQVEKI
jgi:transcriptional antiterminator NusG